MGQEETFDRSEEIIERLMGVSICDKQVERVTHHYGDQIQKKQEAEMKSGKPVRLDNPKQVHYGMLDGGMIHTREDGWREMKVARIFPQSAVLGLHEKRNWLNQSLYVAHLGDHRGFLPQVERIFDSIEKLVIVADGAAWIWQWVQANYPEATQILDFYHAKEYLCRFAEEYFNGEDRRRIWVGEQEKLLLEDDVEIVIRNITKLPVQGRKKAAELKKRILHYYQTHSQRMYYQTFQEWGYMIGSGPIEAAHRHLIQKRLKLSGQHWTVKGAQQVANLRVAYQSNQWGKVTNLIKGAA